MNDVGVCIAALSTLGLLKMCFLADKVVELVGGGSVLNGATTSSFNEWLLYDSQLRVSLLLMRLHCLDTIL